MATTKKLKAVRRRPAPAAQEERSDAPSPAMVSGAPAALRAVPPPVVPDPEVRERAVRRRFTAAYKLQVLRQADQCAGVGELGALLRREGLYSSHLTTWRRQREQGALVALAPKKRGRPAAPVSPLARRVAELERDNARLERRLKQAEAHHGRPKKVGRDPRPLGADARRDREQRLSTVTALAAQVGWQPACAALGVSRATVYRRRRPPEASRPRPQPARALTPAERETVVAQLHSPRFVDFAPREIYATLLDDGQYLCSPRTMYRLLSAAHEVRERRHQRRHGAPRPELLATGPNEVWSWDITKLLGPVKWTYYYLYVILDIFSRYVVGWMVAHAESARLAERLIATACETQGIVPGQLTVHADRGTSMTSKAVALLLADLGVTRTHSRPHVSNDNPFSEAQFKTLKSRPEFPERFGGAEDARAFCHPFFTWYNTEHRHGGIGWLTPAMVHYGHVDVVLTARRQVLAAAYAAHPERFVLRPPAAPTVPNAVWINPPAPSVAPTPSIPDVPSTPLETVGVRQ